MAIGVWVLLHNKALSEGLKDFYHSNALTRSALPWCVHCWTEYQSWNRLSVAASNHTLQVQLSSQSQNQL